MSKSTVCSRVKASEICCWLAAGGGVGLEGCSDACGDGADGDGSSGGLCAVDPSGWESVCSMKYVKATISSIMLTPNLSAVIPKLLSSAEMMDVPLLFEVPMPTPPRPSC